VNAAAIDAIEQVIGRGADPDDVLRDVVDVLVREGGCAWAGILFVENGQLVLGPEAGSPRPDSRAHLPVVYDGDRVAELVADGCDDRQLLERVAELISADCLVGWDTGGVPWNVDA
jgi:hypothetical protein